MATIDQERMNQLVDDAIKKQQSQYIKASNSLVKWHCASLSKENFWRLMRVTAETITRLEAVLRGDKLVAQKNVVACELIERGTTRLN